MRRLKATAAKYFHDPIAMQSVKDAYTYACSISNTNSLIVCTGSLFLVGEMKKDIRSAR